MFRYAWALRVLSRSGDMLLMELTRQPSLQQQTNAGNGIAEIFSADTTLAHSGLNGLARSLEYVPQLEQWRRDWRSLSFHGA